MSESERAKVMKEGEPCTRTHIWLYAEDVEWIDAQCAGGWDNATTRSKFIRLALRRVIRAIQAQAERTAQTLHEQDLAAGS